MSIRVGIQEGIKFVSSSLDDNNNLELQVTQGEEVDALEALTNGGDLGGQESGKIIIWALKGEAYGNPITGKPLVEHIKQYKDFFNEILSQYYPADKIKWGNIFAGTSAKTGEDLEKLTDAEVQVVGKNILTKFVELHNAADTSVSNRVKFYRSSAAKNFITLKPEMFTKFGKAAEGQFRKTWTVPFIESMSIPKEQSKLAYSDYEKGMRNGSKTGLDLSDPNPVVADSAPAMDGELPF